MEHNLGIILANVHMLSGEKKEMGINGFASRRIYMLHIFMNKKNNNRIPVLKKTPDNYDLQRRYTLRNIILILLIVIGFSSCAKVNTNIDLGNQCALGDLWKEAIFRWEKGLDKYENKAVIYNNMAIAYEKIGDKKKAIEFYEKSLSLDPKNEYVKRNLARAKGKERSMTDLKKGRRGRKHEKKK